MRILALTIVVALATFDVQAETKTVKFVAQHHGDGKTQFPPEARLTLTIYDGDVECGNSGAATPPHFLVNFSAHIEEQTKQIDVETMLVGADDYAPLEPKFLSAFTSPTTDLGTHFIVKKATALLHNADHAEKVANATTALSATKLQNALLHADAAVGLSNTAETKLRSKRAKAALQIRSSDPQQKVEAVDTLKSIDLPEEKNVKLSLLQQRFDTYESAVKAFGAVPDRFGLVSGSIDAKITDPKALEILKTELGALVDACREFWPYKKISFDEKFSEYKKKLKSDISAEENIVRITLDRRGEFIVAAQ